RMASDGLAKLLDVAIESYREGDDRAAALIFGELAAQGAVVAQFYLGRMYEVGRGVAHSFERAEHWYRAAADLGLPEAQNNLGRLCARGLAGDASEAETWLVRAAEQGNEDAQLGLAEHYSDRGDRVRAYAWSLVAARGGNAAGASNAGLIRRSLT